VNAFSKVDWTLRRLTGRLRRLPDLIIIGAQKAGTTSLFHYLQQHPQLLPSTLKEVHYFDGGMDPAVDTFEKGESWYRAHFPLAARCGPGAKVFEASPFYLFHPLVPERLATVVPKARLIVLLRNPVDRAISHYFKEHRNGYEDLPIEEAIYTEENRVCDIIAKGQWKDRRIRHYTYKARGRYAEQLERFLARFPREQILIINSGDLTKDTNRILRTIFGFAGVDPGFEVQNLAPRNVGAGKTTVSKQVTEYLREYFMPYNARLFDLLGEDYGWNATG
jgi:hypothetical protein